MKHVLTTTPAKAMKAVANIKSQYPKARLTTRPIGKQVAVLTSKVMDSEVEQFRAAA